MSCVQQPGFTQRQTRIGFAQSYHLPFMISKQFIHPDCIGERLSWWNAEHQGQGTGWFDWDQVSIGLLFLTPNYILCPFICANVSWNTPETAQKMQSFNLFLCLWRSHAFRGVPGLGAWGRVWKHIKIIVIISDNRITGGFLKNWLLSAVYVFLQ